MHNQLLSAEIIRRKFQLNFSLLQNAMQKGHTRDR